MLAARSDEAKLLSGAGALGGEDPLGGASCFKEDVQGE